MANSKFARASRAGHRAGKPGSAAYKAAFRKAFKGRGGGGRRKAPRSAKARSRAYASGAMGRPPKAPRRTRRRMARKRRSGGRRKSIKVSAERIGKALVVIDGARRVATADYSTAAWYVKNEPMGLLGKAWKDKAFTSKLVQPAGGVVEILVGPKLVSKGVTLLSKGEPMIGRVARATIVRA